MAGLFEEPLYRDAIGPGIRGRPPDRARRKMISRLQARPVMECKVHAV